VVCITGAQGGIALKALGIFLDDDETFIVPSRAILEKPTEGKNLLVSQLVPFQLVTIVFPDFGSLF
jgi:hypothetical protein